MFDRLEILIGEKINILKNKTVMLVGLGGVGGSAFESLVRSGIGKIIVVDNDMVDITNLNRQVLAFQSTINKSKVDVAKSLAKNINPDCEIITIKEFINEENFNKLFDYKIDFLIDAIDTIKTKKILIKKSLEKQIPFISIMGTGNKMHPELLEITDIRKTSYDPIAKIIRKMINEEKIKGKIPVIYSKEKPFIKNKVGSNAFVPNSAGLMATSYVINTLLKEEGNGK